AIKGLRASNDSQVWFWMPARRNGGMLCLQLVAHRLTDRISTNYGSRASKSITILLTIRGIRTCKHNGSFRRFQLMTQFSLRGEQISKISSVAECKVSTIYRLAMTQRCIGRGLQVRRLVFRAM